MVMKLIQLVFAALCLALPCAARTDGCAQMNFSTSCSVSPGKLLVLTQLGDDYLDVFENWYFYANRWVQKDCMQMVVVADDDHAAVKLQRVQKSRKWDFLIASPEGMLPDDSLSFMRWAYGTDTYVKWMARRPAYIERLLEGGCSVLFSDIDVVWRGDVLHEITLLSGASGDMYATLDEISEQSMPVFNAGLVFFQPTPFTNKVVKRWAGWLRKHPNPNQPVLNAILRKEGHEHVKRLIKPKFLDGRASVEDASNAVAVHANYMSGHDAKVAFLKKNSLWSDLPPLDGLPLSGVAAPNGFLTDGFRLNQVLPAAAAFRGQTISSMETKSKGQEKDKPEDKDQEKGKEKGKDKEETKSKDKDQDKDKSIGKGNVAEEDKSEENIKPFGGHKPEEKGKVTDGENKLVGVLEPEDNKDNLADGHKSEDKSGEAVEQKSEDKGKVTDEHKSEDEQQGEDDDLEAQEDQGEDTGEDKSEENIKPFGGHKPEEKGKVTDGENKLVGVLEPEDNKDNVADGHKSEDKSDEAVEQKSEDKGKVTHDPSEDEYQEAREDVPPKDKSEENIKPLDSHKSEDKGKLVRVLRPKEKGKMSDGHKSEDEGDVAVKQKLDDKGKVTDQQKPLGDGKSLTRIFRSRDRAPTGNPAMIAIQREGSKRPHLQQRQLKVDGHGRLVAADGSFSEA